MSAYFGSIEPIQHKGPDAKDPLAFRWYDKDRLVLGKTMEEHLRIAVCYWHSFAWDGADIFGPGTFDRPWHKDGESRAAMTERMVAAFDFFTRLSTPYFTFHDVDVVGTSDTAKDHMEAMAWGVDALEAKMSSSGVGLLWGTANVFSHPRFMAGASTNPDPEVAAFAALQVRLALEATNRLGGSNYVLWGGREGYDTILNTDLGQELDQMGRFLAAVVEHKHKIGFKGDILLEPKPHEPSKHQYDRDTATVYGFLKRYGLEGEVNVNIEPNHATLAGNSFVHEVETAFALGLFGSIDFNRGDPQNGWDTDQFPNDVREITHALYAILKGGGFKNGGSNFDAKVRRQSRDPEDLFHAHIGGIDILAKGLLNAAAMIEDDKLQAFKTERYACWSEGSGQQFLQGDLSLTDFAEAALHKDETPKPVSGRQEYLEGLLTRAVEQNH